MGFWSRLLGREQRSVTRVGPLELFRDILTGRSSKSGVTVNADTALQVTTVLSAARVLAEDVSGLPLKLYEMRGGTRVLLGDDPIQRVLDQPNDWQTGQEFREQLMLHAVLCGNGMAWKNVVRGELKELLPLQPSWYTVEQQADWTLVYKVRLPDGTAFNLRGKDVLHLRGPSWGGGVGMEVIRLAREAIGLALATEGAHASMHANGLQTPGLYSVDGTLNEEQYKQLRAHIEANQSGQDNAFRLFLLDRGAKYTPIGMTGVDAQHLETRRYQVEEICRAVRVFPQMVGYSDKASTFASAEQFFLAHVKYSLLPWVRRWEGVGLRDLIGRARQGVYLKHNVAALERADIKTRYTAYGQGIKDGWLLRNEARGWEDLDEIDGLSEPLQPLNMATPADAQAEQTEGGQPTKGRRPFAEEVREFDPGKHPRDENGKFKGRGAGRRRVRRMARRAIADKSHRENLDLGGVERAAFSEAAGRDVQGWRVGLHSDQVRHIHVEHGSSRSERPRGQVPVTADDYTKLRTLVHSRGAVSAGGLTRAQKLQTVVVTGTVGKARYQAILTVNKRTRSLRVWTLLKWPR